MSIEELVEITKDENETYNRRLIAAEILQYTVDSELLINDFLILAIQGPKDASDLFKSACIYSIENILIRNGKNK